MEERGPPGKRTWKLTGDLTRCQSIGLEASTAFLSGNAIFELIWRVSDELSLLEAKEQVQRLHITQMHQPVLLWADLWAGIGPQLGCDIASFLKEVLRNSPASVVLLTCCSGDVKP